MPEIPASELLVPLPIQQSAMKSQLDSAMLGNFLMGVYTMLYFGTLYLYVTTKGPQGRIVIGALTILYLLSTGGFALTWYLLQWSFVDNAETRQSIFLTLFNLPGGLHILENILAFLVIVVADGLLIWRCFHIWGRSIHVILLPCFLLVAEIALLLSSIIILFAEKLDPSHKEALTIDNLDGAAYIVSSVTTLMTTLLISYRIYSASRNSDISRGRFRHVIEIVAESAVIYSITLLIQAISVVLPFSITNTQLFGLQSYIDDLLAPIAGITQTIIVARVCLAADKTHRSGTFQLSGIRFEGRSPSRNTTQVRMDDECVMDSDSALVLEDF